MQVMNGSLVTREENSIELEDYSFQWLTLLPKLHLKNFNETENKEEPSTALYRECVHVQVSLYVSNVFLSWL